MNTHNYNETSQGMVRRRTGIVNAVFSMAGVVDSGLVPATANTDALAECGYSPCISN